MFFDDMMSRITVWPETRRNGDGNRARRQRWRNHLKREMRPRKRLAGRQGALLEALPSLSLKDWRTLEVSPPKVDEWKEDGGVSRCRAERRRSWGRKRQTSASDAHVISTQKH